MEARLNTPEQSNTIIIVDGCSMTRECLGAMLRAKNYKVHSAPTIKKAIPLIKQHTPDVIIHEVDFADGNAEILINTVGKLDSITTPTFFLITNNSDKTRLLQIIEQGVSQVIIKPSFTLKIFFNKLQSLILKSTNGNTKKNQKKPTQPQTQEPTTQTQRNTIKAFQSGLHISKDDSKAILKSIKPIMSRADALERINQVASLKALSPTVARVLAMTRSSEASMDDITMAIRNDHAIALKIIQIANSAAFSRSEPVTTLSQAVMRMGCEQIRQTVVNIEIMKNFSADTCQYVDHRLFWEHSIAVGACCSLLARDLKEINPDEAFTLGLLHDVGRMVLFQAFGSDYIDTIQTARENHFPIELIERRRLLVDHATIMNTVLHQWGLHNDLIEPIVNHHLSVGNIRQTCHKRMIPVSMVALANRIVHALGIGCSGNQTVYATEDFFEALKLPTNILNTIATKLPEMVIDIRLSMLGGPDFNTFPEPHQPCQGLDLNPLYITLDESTDAIAHWINAFVCSENTAPPNLIVARMRKERQSVTIDRKITELEQKFKVKNLPTVILSNTGKLTLPEISRQDRQVQTLPTPFTFDQFDRLARSLLTQSDQDPAQAA